MRKKIRKRKPQAIPYTESQTRFQRIRKFNWKYAWIQLAFFAILATGIDIYTSTDFRIESIKILGKIPHVDSQNIDHVTDKYIGKGFFAIDVKKVQRDFLKIPWVTDASIWRIWPSHLIVNLQEQQAFVRWGDDSLLNVKGELFTPKLSTIPQDLPLLIGPVGEEKNMLQKYVQFSQKLNSKGLFIQEMILTPRHAWQLQMSNNITIRLGRSQIDDRLQRFVASYQGTIGSRGSEVEYVDMRYNNGLAIKWRK